MGFGHLRVISEDRITPGKGFGTHGHRDMKILSYVLSGELAHNNSLRTGSIIRAGDLQRMTAGTGVAHSEFNASSQTPVHFLQIWMLPERNGLPPSYEQKTFGRGEQRTGFRLIGARDGRHGTVTIHQDVDLCATLLSRDAEAIHDLRAGHIAWIQVTSGAVTLNGQPMAARDGVGIRTPGPLRSEGMDMAEVLLFDMAV
jgi:redox-sensitive bicupin YhaK (pirin superfamily)